MSGPGTKLAERELEEEAGSARVPRERARPTAAQSLLRAGGGGAGECVRLARAREGPPLPTPAPTPARPRSGPGLCRRCGYCLPLLQPCALPALPALLLSSSPPLPTGLPHAQPPLGYCFRVTVTWGEQSATRAGSTRSPRHSALTLGNRACGHLRGPARLSPSPWLRGRDTTSSPPCGLAPLRRPPNPSTPRGAHLLRLGPLT